MTSNFCSDLDRLISASDAKKILGIGTTTLYKLCRSGSLHPVMLSRRCTRFRVSEIFAFIDAHTKIGGAA
jgi:predicted DNA-binding transcriptional regulator AlpA